MQKIKIRCLEEFLNFSDHIDVVKVFKVLNGGWANYKLYQCKCCGEIYVHELGSFSDEKVPKNGYCVNCNAQLENNLIEYPTQILFNNEVINTNINLDVFTNIEESIIKEFYLLP
jgi:hypothetical protein